MFFTVTEAQQPWRWRFPSEAPELAAKVAPPDLAEWVLNLEISGTIFVKDYLEDCL